MKAFITLICCLVVAVSALTEEEERHFGKPDGRCPAVDVPGETVHFEHDSSCEMFYKCSFGRAYLMDCPQGMWWSQKDLYCDRPQGNCAKKVKSSQFIGLCPNDDDPHKPVHYPHPFDCDKFYKCLRGEGILQECPGGLHFSTRTDRCERPEDAECRA